MVTGQTLRQMLPVPKLTNVKVDGINWQFVDTSTPGGCSDVEWCEGQHAAPTETTEKVFHSRSIGSAMNSETSALPVEVIVAQWKAAPGVTWIAGGSGGGWPNRDKPPQVGIFTASSSAADGMWLERPWGDPLVAVLHGIGQRPFADLLAVAIQFARQLDEETK